MQLESSAVRTGFISFKRFIFCGFQQAQVDIKDQGQVQCERGKPFGYSIEKDVEDKEHLSIASITDRNGAELSDSCIEIHIQSLGVDENEGGEQYWLDSGAFNF